MADNWTAEDEARYLAGVDAADVPESVRDYMRSEESFPDDEHISQARQEAQRDAMDTEDEAAAGRPQRDDPLDQAVWAAILKHEANLPRGGRRGYAEGGEADIPPEDAPPPAPPPTTGPPPFDPSKPFSVGTRASLPPPFDPSKPFSVKETPLWTAEKPFLPKTLDEAQHFRETAAPGSFIKHPKTGELFKQPPPSVEPEVTPEQESIDLSGLGFTAPPKPPGYAGTFFQSVGKGAYEGAEALAHAPTAFAPVTPKQPDESETGKLLEKGFWEGITDPKWLVAQVGHGAGGMAPLAATAGAGAALGSIVPGVGTAAGGVAGLVVGAAASALRPAFERASAAGLEWGDAVQRSIVESGLAGAIAGVMPAASRISMFGRVPITDAAGNLTRDAAGKIAEKMAHPVSEVLAQTLGVQPALMTGQQVAEAAIEGRKPTFDELAKGYVGGAGGGAAFVAGHHLARGAMGRGEQPATGGRTEPGTAPPPPGGAPPPGGLPPVGEAFGMDVGRGVEPVVVASHTPAGDVVLMDAEGQLHPMAAADVARLRQEIAAPSSEAKTTEEEAPPAAPSEDQLRGAWYAIGDYRDVLADRLESILAKKGSLDYNDIPRDLSDKIDTGSLAVVKQGLAADPAAAIAALRPRPGADTATETTPPVTSAPDVTRVTPPAADQGEPDARSPDLFGDDGSVMANLDRIGAEIEAGPEAERAKLEAVVRGESSAEVVAPVAPAVGGEGSVLGGGAEGPAAPSVVRPLVAPEPPPAAAPAPPVREEPPAPVVAPEAGKAAPAPAEAPPEPKPELNIFGLPVGVQLGPREKTTVGNLKQGDWIYADGKVIHINNVSQNADGSIKVELESHSGINEGDFPESARVERYTVPDPERAPEIPPENEYRAPENPVPAEAPPAAGENPEPYPIGSKIAKTLGVGDVVHTDTGEWFEINFVDKLHRFYGITWDNGKNSGLKSHDMAAIFEPQPYEDTNTGERRFSEPATVEKAGLISPDVAKERRIAQLTAQKQRIEELPSRDDIEEDALARANAELAQLTEGRAAGENPVPPTERPIPEAPSPTADESRYNQARSQIEAIGTGGRITLGSLRSELKIKSDTEWSALVSRLEQDGLITPKPNKQGQRTILRTEPRGQADGQKETPVLPTETEGERPRLTPGEVIDAGNGDQKLRDEFDEQVKRHEAFTADFAKRFEQNPNFEFTKDNHTYFASRDLNGENPWRLTHFLDGEPTGHMEFRTPEEVAQEAWRLTSQGYEMRERPGEQQTVPRGPFEYGLRYRPAGYGTVPDGRVGERQDPRFPNYGIVQYDRPLTPEEIRTFELEPIPRGHVAVENPVEAGDNVTRVTPEEGEARQPIAFRPIRDNTDPAFIPSTGASFPIQYAIVEARDLVTSHHDDLSPNRDYPQALQPRSRERAETEAQLSGILNGDPRDPNATFRPELLGENPDAANGSPIIGPEGYVESGNARTMAIRRAYDRDLPQAQAYRAALEAQGYPIEGIEQPVLVRINRAEMDMPAREQLARDLNVAPQATMSASDRAMADAQQIPGDLLRLYSGGDIFSAANRAFWKGILDRIAKPSELPTMTNPEGGLSPAGQTRVKNALLAKAYGDKDFVTALTEDADSNIKAIGNALNDAAPHWARLRDAVAEGRVPAEYDLTSPLIEAVRLIQHARDEGRNVVEYMNQRGLFGEGVSAETESLLRWMLGPPEWSRRHGREKIADTMVEYADSVLRPLRLGETRVAPPLLVENAREVAHGAAGDLFASPLGEPGGAAAVREGAGQNRPEAPGPEVNTTGADAPESRPAEAAKGRRPAGGLAEETRSEPAFFSALTRAVEAIPQPKAPGAQWANLIRNLTNKGVKQDEIAWSGVLDWLKDNPGLVTKERLLDELRANEVRVEEVQHGAPTEPPEIAAKRERFQDLLDKEDAGAILSPEEKDELLRLNEDLLQHQNPYLQPRSQGRYGQYTLPGGENYRELLLTLPGRPFSPAALEARKAVFDRYAAEIEALNDRSIDTRLTQAERNQAFEQANSLRERRNAEAEKVGPESPAYRTSHWEEPNVLAHIRMDDRTDAEGRKVLHVAEIQSDWHQAGRRKGYGTPEPQFTVIDQNGNQRGSFASHAEADAYLRAPPEFIDAANSHIQEVEPKQRGVPNAPLKTQWPELAIKRVLRYAAENGYDRVTWDSGETQAARYDLSKQIQAVRWNKETGDFQAKDHAGRVVMREKASPERLDDLVGKDVADKLRSSPDIAPELSGLDLKVGGEGMRGFYDKILPAFLNKYAKKWGAKVEAAEIETAPAAPKVFQVYDNRGDYVRDFDTLSAANDYVAHPANGLAGAEVRMRGGIGAAVSPAHAIDITQPMRDSVMAGQALWERQGKGAAAASARSLTEDLQTARATGEYQPGLADSHRAARDFVRLMGRDSGNEHFGSVDTRTGEIRDAGTSDHPTEINFNQDTLRQLWNPPDGQTVDIHHNHGGGMPASGADISMLAAPGVRWIVAHGIEGTVNGRAMFSAVALRPEARAWLDRMSPEQATKALQNLSDRAEAQIAPVFKQAIDSGRIDQATADLLARETINTALAGAGVIHYMSNLKLPDGALPFASRVARDLAKNLPWEIDGKLSNNRVRQSARAVRTEEGMDRLSRPLEGGSETRQRPDTGIDQPRRAGLELPVEPRETGSDQGSGARPEAEAQPAGNVDAGVHRPSDTVQHDRAVAEFPGQHEEELAAGRAAGAGNDSAGRTGTGESPTVGGLAEETGGAGGRPPGDRGPTEPPGGGGAEEERAALRRIMHTDERSLVDRLRGFIDGFRTDLSTRFKQGFLDDTAGLERAERAVSGGNMRDASVSPTIMTRLTRNLDSVMATVVGVRQGDGFAGGALRYNPDSGAFETAAGSKPFAAVFKPVFERGLQDQWALWAITNRAKRLMAEGREHNVSEEDIARYANLDQKYLAPDGTNLFRQTLDEWRDLNKRTLDMAEQVGLVNKDQRALWEHEDYVPFFRALDEDAVLAPGTSRKGIANIRSGIKQLKGGEEKVANIYENMVRNLSSMVDRSMKNEAMRRTVATLSGTDALTPLSKIAREDLQTPEAKARLEAMGLDPANMSGKARAAATDLFGMIAKKDPDLVSVMEGGKPQYYRVNDPLLLRSLVSMGPEAAGGIVKTLLGGAKKILTHSVTVDPAFMAANLLRDTVHSWVVTGHGFTPGIDTARGFVEALRNSPSAVALMAGGAGGGHFYAAAPERVRQMLESHGFKDSLLDSPRKLWDTLQHIGRASEQANRIAIYEAAIKEGATHAEGLARAQDMLNFTMRGDFAAMRFLTETVPFMNARVQGLYRLYRGARDNPASFLMRGGLVTAAAIALWAANKDDERYKALEDWDRQNYFHFFIGDGHYRLPQPFEVGAIFASIPEMLLNYYENGRWKELQHAFVATVSNQLNLNPTPQLLKPAIELYANKDSFTGRPIVSQAEEKLVPALQYGPQASPTMVALAGGLGVSPDQAEHLLRGYGGTMATYLLAASDAMASATGLTAPHATKRLDQLPFVSRFVREEPALGTRWLTEFYELKTEVDQLYNSMKQYAKMGDAKAAGALVEADAKKIGMHKGMDAMGEKLSALRRAIRQIDNDPKMDPDEKRRRLDALLTTRNRLAESVRPLIQNVEGLSARP